MSDKIYNVNFGHPPPNLVNTIDKLPPNPTYLDVANADFDKLRRWAKERRVCRCRVSRRDPAIRDPKHPKYFENLYIDDLNCELHRTVRVIREIAAEGKIPPGPPFSKGGNTISDSLACGCRPGDGVPCEAASRMMDQMQAALSRPAAPDNWARYERLKSWLGRHYKVS